MTEWYKNAWLLGWKQYTDDGKLAALLLIALMLFWFVGKERRKRHVTLGIYTTVAAVFCICPLTAAVLMKYQTKFYDYQWIWNLVPMTIFIALTGTWLWTTLTERYAGREKFMWKAIGITLAMLGVVYLSGRMGNTIWDTEDEAAKRTEAARVLETLTEQGQDVDIILWAPRGIMEYARALDGDICLPYGRNMWDDSLNAYTYDSYGENEELLYEWMCVAEETGEGATSAADSMVLAKEMGVTHILLPGNLLPESLAEAEAALSVRAEALEGYYLLRVQ